MKLKRMFLIIMCLSMLLGMCGCKKLKEDIPKEEPIKFATFTQEERAEYVENYLKEEYGLETEVGEVFRKQDGVFFLEDEYFAIARCKDEKRIHCWVTEEGKIMDSQFLNDLEEPIDKLFEEIIYEKLPNCKVICYSILNSPTEKTWNENEIKQMLATENIEIILHIFVDKNEKETVEELYENEFDGAFSFTNGACFIYMIEGEEMENIENMDWSMDSMLFTFEKD